MCNINHPKFPCKICAKNVHDKNIAVQCDLFELSLSLKPSSKLEFLVNQFNNATPENGNDPEKNASSKYYDIDEMYNTSQK